MWKLVLIGSGGFFGSIFRYIISGAVHRFFDKPLFPLGTLLVNLAGCGLMGFFSGITESRQLLTPETRLFLLIGFLGSFTTFSTFGYESFNLLRDSQFLATFLNIALQVILGVFAVYLGIVFSRIF